MEYHHMPVFFNEALDLLQISNDNTYIDCTLGGGGHFQAILERFEQGTLIGFDVDEDAIQTAQMKLLNLGYEEQILDKTLWKYRKADKQAFLVRDNFQNIEISLKKLQGLQKIQPVMGILLDLGVSSHQLDIPEKGFSYMKDGPLDMRMDAALQVSAKDLVNALYEKELAKILTEYGEEVFATRIARAIIKARSQSPIQTTGELAKIIRHNTPSFYKNPYAKTFQALRIAVNDELGVLKHVCSEISAILDKKGRVVFISFHSLEDKIVKQSFQMNQLFSVVQDVVKPTTEAIDENKRARSAKMRCFEKL